MRFGHIFAVSCLPLLSTLTFAQNGLAEVEPSGCEAVGAVCDDGTIFAGISPDSDVKMYATPEDAPGYYSEGSGYPWSAAPKDSVLPFCEDRTDNQSCESGKSNSDTLAELFHPDPSGKYYMYPAARYCAALDEFGSAWGGGHDDDSGGAIV